MLVEISFFCVVSTFSHDFDAIYSGDLNSELVRYSNGPKQFARRMVRYSVKMHISNSIRSVQHPNTSQNTQHPKAT